MSKVVLTAKGRRWLESGHPWIYRDDLKEVSAENGDLAAVEDPRGALVGWGTYSAASRIAVRLVTRANREPDRDFWRARVYRAIRARTAMGLGSIDGACRWIAGDADGVPGLVADRYARTLVLQCGTLAADRLRELVADLVAEISREELGLELQCVVDRSDSAARKLEALDRRVEVMRGELPEALLVRELDLEYEVDVLSGHKTGHYLDQRDNRRRAARHARGRRVLDAFSYDGLFGIRAALAGAESVLCIDQSASALERAARNAERNCVADRVRVLRADCMDELRTLARADERFGLVILDPPAFAKNRREVAGAERGYVEVNRRAMQLVSPGGTLVTASCSYNVRPEAFVVFLARAAARAGREAYLEALCGAAPDHPALLTLPESAYLKCAFLRVEEEPRMRGETDSGASSAEEAAIGADPAPHDVERDRDRAQRHSP
jgi:23S rRNA (cytosine1962-C5)-methyltransferase